MVKRVALAPKLDTSAAADLRKSIVQSEGDDLAFDASEVEMLGALCLEALMSAVAIWKSSGHTVSFENTSPQMQDDLGRFGLTPETLLEYAA